MTEINPNEFTLEQTAHMLAFVAQQIVRKGKETKHIAVEAGLSDDSDFIVLIFKDPTSGSKNTGLQEEKNKAGIQSVLTELDAYDIIDAEEVNGLQRTKDSKVEFVNTNRKEKEVWSNFAGHERKDHSNLIVKTRLCFQEAGGYTDGTGLIDKEQLHEAVMHGFEKATDLNGLLPEKDAEAFMNTVEKSEDFTVTGLAEPKTNLDELRRTFQATLIQIHKKVVPFVGDEAAREFIKDKTGYTVPERQLKAA